MVEDDDYTVLVTGDGTSVQRNVDAEVAAQVISLIMTGRAAAVGAPATKVSASAQEAVEPRFSLREFLDEISPSGHAEKISAIALYLTSHESRQSFSKEDILGRYRTAREAAPANFHRDFANAIKSGWIAEDTSVAGAHYVTQKGTKFLEGKRNAGSTVPASARVQTSGAETAVSQDGKSQRRKTSGSKTTQWSIVDDLLDASGRATLKEFYATKQPNGQNEQVAVLSFKLKELTGRPGFSGDDIYTALQIVGARTPGNLVAVFGNMALAGLGRVQDKAFHPSFKTDDLVKLDLPRSKSKGDGAPK